MACHQAISAHTFMRVAVQGHPSSPGRSNTNTTEAIDAHMVHMALHAPKYPTRNGSVACSLAERMGDAKFESDAQHLKQRTQTLMESLEDIAHRSNIIRQLACPPSKPCKTFRRHRRFHHQDSHSGLATPCLFSTLQVFTKRLVCLFDIPKP